MVKRCKKLVCVLCVFLLMAFVFSGCSQNITSGTNDVTTKPEGSQKVEPAEKTVIQFFSNKTGQQDYMQRMFDKYNEENDDNIEVETIWRSGDWQTGVKTSILAGQGPTVMTGRPFDLVEGIIDGVYDSWDDYISPEFSEKYHQYKYMKEVDNVFKTYGWGYLVTTRKLIYNKDLFEMVGETEPPASWQDFRRIAKKITEAGDGRIFGTAMPVGGGQIGLWADTLFFPEGLPKLYDYGTGLYDFSSLVPIVEVWREIINDGSVFPGFESMDNDAVRAQFAAGNVGMLLSFSWDVSCINDQFSAECDWDAAPLPAINGVYKSKPDLRIELENWLNNAATLKEKQAAGKFIEFFMSDEFVGGYMAEGCGIAAIDSAVEYANKQVMRYPIMASYAPYPGGVGEYTTYGNPSSTLEGDNRNVVITHCLLDMSIDAKAVLEDCAHRYNLGILARAQTDIEKAKQMTVKIGGLGEMPYIEGYDPMNPDFSKFRYLSIDEWSELTGIK